MSEQTQGDSGGLDILVCYSQWGHKELDMTEQLNNNTCFLYANFLEFFFFFHKWILNFIKMCFFIY